MKEDKSKIYKEPWLSVVLSSFVAGAGQIYSGQISRGIVLVILKIIIYCSALWSVLSAALNIKIGIGLFVVLAVFNIWNLFDAHKCAKRVNTEDFENSRKHNKDPWLAVFLSGIIPGVGHLYIRRWFLGVILILCSLALVSIKATLPLFFFGLWAFLSALACYHAYISSPFRRECSKKVIVIITTIILALKLLDYASIPYKSYVVEAYKMTAGAMAPTLMDQDRMLVRKYDGDKIGRGDVIVFKSPEDPTISWIKRLVAFEGESIEIRSTDVYINGEKVKCPSIQNIKYVSEGNFGIEGKPYIVPGNSFFVLGDDSSNSNDSRFYGAIPKSDLVGKAYKIYWPPKRMGPIR